MQVWGNIGDKLVDALLSRKSVNDSFEAHVICKSEKLWRKSKYGP